MCGVAWKWPGGEILKQSSDIFLNKQTGLEVMLNSVFGAGPGRPAPLYQEKGMTSRSNQLWGNYQRRFMNEHLSPTPKSRGCQGKTCSALPVWFKRSIGEYYGKFWERRRENRFMHIKWRNGSADRAGWSKSVSEGWLEVMWFFVFDDWLVMPAPLFHQNQMNNLNDPAIKVHPGKTSQNGPVFNRSTL